MVNQDFQADSSNIYTLDIFNLLAEDDNDSKYVNTLKRTYCNMVPFDSHPNKDGSKLVGEMLGEMILKMV